MTSQASYKFLQPLRRTANLQPKVVTMQVSGAALARDGRATMTALIGAGMFGLVPHPIASLGSYRHDRCEVLRWGNNHTRTGCTRAPQARK